MSTVVKAYTFLDKITVDASEVNRDFDDLYATINNLNSENMATTFTHPASQVSIVDTASNYAYTEIEAVIGQPTSLQRGLHELHVVPQGSNAIKVFPGKVEIGGQICVVSSQFEVSGLEILSTGTTTLSWYIVCGQPVALGEITASDLYLVAKSSVTTTGSTNDYDISAMGYYYGSKRLVGAGVAPGAGETCRQILRNSYNPDPVQKAFRLFTAASGDIEQLFGISQNMQGLGTDTAYTNLFSISVFYDMDQGAYGYRADIQIGSACSSQIHMGTGSLHYNYEWDLTSRASFYSSTQINNITRQVGLTIHVSDADPPSYMVAIANPMAYAEGNY